MSPQRHPLLLKIQDQLSDQELDTLKAVSAKFPATTTLLPIKSVGVQVRAFVAICNRIQCGEGFEKFATLGLIIS